MSSQQKKVSATAFLRKRKGSNNWYASVVIPRELRRQFGDVRLTRSLHTDSLKEAQEKRWMVVAELKATIQAAKRAALGLPPSLLEEARKLRAALLANPD